MQLSVLFFNLLAQWCPNIWLVKLGLNFCIIQVERLKVVTQTVDQMDWMLHSNLSWLLKSFVRETTFQNYGLNVAINIKDDRQKWWSVNFVDEKYSIWMLVVQTVHRRNKHTNLSIFKLYYIWKYSNCLEWLTVWKTT